MNDETFTITFTITAGPDHLDMARTFWGDATGDFDGVGIVWADDGKMFMSAAFLDSEVAVRFTKALQDCFGTPVTLEAKGPTN